VKTLFLFLSRARNPTFLITYKPVTESHHGRMLVFFLSSAAVLQFACGVYICPLGAVSGSRGVPKICKAGVLLEALLAVAYGPGSAHVLVEEREPDHGAGRRPLKLKSFREIFLSQAGELAPKECPFSLRQFCFHSSCRLRAAFMPAESS